MATMRVTPMNMPAGAHLERFGALGEEEDSFDFTFDGTAGESPAFTEGKIVVLWPDANCCIRIGVDVDATTDDQRLGVPANEGYVRYVAEGQRISAIAR